MLTGRVIIVTGAAQGMGQAAVEHLRNEGASVMAGDINDAQLATVVEPLGDHVTAHRLDVTDESDWAHVVEAAVQRYGRIDGLVNNAGIYARGPIETFETAVMRQLLAVNLVGPWLGMKAVVPHMKGQRAGSIVNISSIEGITTACDATAYGATKWGLRGITKALAKELGPFGVRVNCVMPGAIDTPMLRTGMGDVPFETRFPDVAFNRPGNAFEIARCTAFLLSDGASYVSGADLVADGAWTCGIYTSGKPSPDDHPRTEPEL